MSKRKRNNENIFDDSFVEAGEAQKKKLKEFKTKSTCQIENNYVHIPMIGEDGNVIYDGKSMRTKEKNIVVNNCFLQGLDKETIASSVATTRQWLNKNLNSNLPIYLINAHSSFDPRLQLEMQYDDEGKRVTRKELREREEKEAKIREYDYVEQLIDGMSVMRNDNSINGPNFFTSPEGVFIIETTPVSYDAACGTNTLRRFFRNNIRDNFNTFRNSFLSSKFNDVFYSGDSNNSVRLIIPPKMSTFNKVYTFDDEKGVDTTEKYGILKFSQDMDNDQLQSRIEELMPVKILIDGSDDEILQKKFSAVYSNSEMEEKIRDSIINNTSISLQQITNTLGPGIYLDFSCSSLVYKIFERQTDGTVTRKVFDPDLYNVRLKEEGRINMVIYNILLENFEELERQYKLHMNNIVQRDDNDNTKFHFRLPDSSDRINYLKTASMKYADANRILTEKRKGLQDPNLMDVDTDTDIVTDVDTDVDDEMSASELSSSVTEDSNIYIGGKNKRMKKRKTKKNLPKLRKLTKKNVRHHYKLKYSTRKRRMAINEGVRTESKKRGMTVKKAAISKKGRFNILRIYRKNKDPKACRKITKDMRYMDKKYKLGKTKNICKKTDKKKKKVKRKTRRR